MKFDIDSLLAEGFRLGYDLFRERAGRPLRLLPVDPTAKGALESREAGGSGVGIIPLQTNGRPRFDLSWKLLELELTIDLIVPVS